MKAMILAAGLGTRLQPFTLHHPKALAMVNGKSLLQHNIEYLKKYNINEIIVNVHHYPEQIQEAIDTNKGWGSAVSISDESAEVLETGGGLLKAKHFLNDGNDFLLMNVDMLTDLNLGKMIENHKKHNTLATLAVSQRTSNRVFLFDPQHTLCGWKNRQTGEEKIVKKSTLTLQEMAFSGIHVINSEIYNHITQTGKFGMVELYLSLAAQNTIRGYDHTGCKLLDVGKPESIAQAEILFGN